MILSLMFKPLHVLELDTGDLQNLNNTSSDANVDVIKFSDITSENNSRVVSKGIILAYRVQSFAISKVINHMIA